MNEILQKRIEEKSKELGQMFFPDNMNVFARPNWEAGYIETACKEIANFALQNQWIPVEEALPDVDEQVIAMSEFGDIERMKYHNKAFYHLKGSIIKDGEKITHWMNIPQLKGDEK